MPASSSHSLGALVRPRPLPFKGATHPVTDPTACGVETLQIKGVLALLRGGRASLSCAGLLVRHMLWGSSEAMPTVSQTQCCQISHGGLSLEQSGLEGRALDWTGTEETWVLFLALPCCKSLPLSVPLFPHLQSGVWQMEQQREKFCVGEA
ncbi:unnamed protein product [Lepidochelys kempii]